MAGLLHPLTGPTWVRRALHGPARVTKSVPKKKKKYSHPHPYTHAPIYTPSYGCLYIARGLTHNPIEGTSIHVSQHTPTFTSVHSHTHTHAHTCMHAHLHMHTLPLIHTHTHPCTHSGIRGPVQHHPSAVQLPHATHIHAGLTPDSGLQPIAYLSWKGQVVQHGKAKLYNIHSGLTPDSGLQPIANLSCKGHGVQKPLHHHDPKARHTRIPSMAVCIDHTSPPCHFMPHPPQSTAVGSPPLPRPRAPHCPATEQQTYAEA